MTVANLTREQHILIDWVEEQWVNIELGHAHSAVIEEQEQNVVKPEKWYRDNGFAYATGALHPLAKQNGIGCEWSICKPSKQGGLDSYAGYSLRLVRKTGELIIQLVKDEEDILFERTIERGNQRGSAEGAAGPLASA